MSVYANIAFVFFLAIMVAYGYATSRDVLFQETENMDLSAVVPIMTLSSVLFALLATFTISNLWKRYQDIRNYLVEQLNKLRFLYLALKNLEGTEDIRRNIKLYANSLADEQLKSLGKERHSAYVEGLYKKIIEDVLDYTHIHKPHNMFIIIGNLYTGEMGGQLLTPELNRALYFVIILTAVLTLGAFWFLNLVDFRVQFVVDLFVIIIIGLVLYIIQELSNPFRSDLLRSSFDCIYDDFLKVLEEEMPE